MTRLNDRLGDAYRAGEIPASGALLLMELFEQRPADRLGGKRGTMRRAHATIKARAACRG